jgi:hypothetical protein
MDRLLLPVAIVVAGVAIGLGLYFGLQRAPQQLPPVAHEVGAAAPAPAPPVPPEVAPVAAPPAAATGDVIQAAERHATMALDAHKKTVFLAECWEPIVAREPAPGTSRYIFQSTFDAEGREFTRAISEVRDTASRPDVAQCLRQLPMTLRIPAPGMIVQVNLELEFP